MISINWDDATGRCCRHTYYLIDKTKLLRNMEKIAYVREKSGAKALLALKCFATWSVFDFMAQLHGRHDVIIALRSASGT